MVSTIFRWMGVKLCQGDCGGHEPLNSAVILESPVSFDLIG